MEFKDSSGQLIRTRSTPLLTTPQAEGAAMKTLIDTGFETIEVIEMEIKQSANKPIPKWCKLPVTTECWNIIAGHAIRQGRKCCRNCEYLDPPYKGANSSHS